jgi:hypothetical protein
MNCYTCMIMSFMLQDKIKQSYNCFCGWGPQVLQELNLTMDQFVDLCILCGCDYCDTIRGGCFSFWRRPSHTFHFRVQHQNLAGSQTVGS